MLRYTDVILAFVAATCLAGCGSVSDRPPVDAAAGAQAPPPRAAATPPAKAAARPRIVALGDSLTAGLGLDPEESYPALLQKRLDAGGFNYEVVNAGVSGDTSAGGLSRLDWALDGDVRLLIVALGGNDALRALPANELRQNLSHITYAAVNWKNKNVLACMEPT